MQIFVPDTNFFLQCKKPEGLTWSEVTDEQEILILVPRTVQKEIDRLKQDHNKRRARRARAANSMFRSAVESHTSEVTLKQSGPVIRLGFLPSRKTIEAEDTDLDASIPDDRILMDVMAYNASASAAAKVLTGDTGIMLSAKNHKIPFCSVPDTWLLDLKQAIAEGNQPAHHAGLLSA